MPRADTRRHYSRRTASVPQSCVVVTFTHDVFDSGGMSDERRGKNYIIRELTTSAYGVTERCAPISKNSPEKVEIWRKMPEPPGIN